MIKTIASFVLFALGTIALAGCLKDDLYDDGVTQPGAAKNPQMIIETGVTATDTSNFMTLALNNSNNDTVINLVPINLAANWPATEDIEVVVEKDDAAVNSVNAETGSNLMVPSANMYHIENPGNVVKIAKGSRTGFVKLKLKPSAYLGGEWAMGFRIKSVTTPGYVISKNFNVAVVKIAIKNAYEGSYRATGYFNHPTSPRNYERNKYLSTVDATTFEMELGDLGSATTILVTVNPNNTVTIAPGPAATPNTAAIAGDPVYNNTYDPTTKTFKLKYGYVTSAPRIVTETVRRQ